MEEPSQVTFESIEFKEGTTKQQIKNAQGEVYPFYLTIPPLQSNNKFPLVLALHWAGGGDVYNEFHHCLAIPAFSDVPAVIVSPDGNYDVWYSETNKSMVVELINKALTSWPVDPEKVIVTGYSNGGIGSWYFAEHHSDVISAAIPVAAQYAPQSVINIPTYIIHGESDELFDVNLVRNMVTTWAKKGANLQLKVVPEFSHYMACAYAEELKKAVNEIMSVLEN